MDFVTSCLIILIKDCTNTPFVYSDCLCVMHIPFHPLIWSMGILVFLSSISLPENQKQKPTMKPQHSTLHPFINLYSSFYFLKQKSTPTDNKSINISNRLWCSRLRLWWIAITKRKKVKDFFSLLYHSGLSVYDLA